MRATATRFAAVCVLLPALAIAHGGRLDKNGCHHDRKRGGYHCHGGIPAPSPAGSSTARGIAATVPPDNPDGSARTSLNLTLLQLDQDFARAEVSGKLESGYDPRLFESAIATAKANVMHAFRDHRHRGLRSYVTATFPRRDVELGDGGTLVTTMSARKYLAVLTAYIERLRDISPLSLDLAVRSKPREAIVMICHYEHPHCDNVAAPAATGTTNTKVKSFYRGLYWYKIEKYGFKTITGPLNLVDRNAGTLQCRLVAESRPGAALPCNLE